MLLDGAARDAQALRQRVGGQSLFLLQQRLEQLMLAIANHVSSVQLQTDRSKLTAINA